MGNLELGYELNNSAMPIVLFPQIPKFHEFDESYTCQGIYVIGLLMPRVVADKSWGGISGEPFEMPGVCILVY